MSCYVIRPPTENDVTDMDPKEDAAKSPKPKEPSEGIKSEHEFSENVNLLYYIIRCTNDRLEPFVIIDSPKGGQGDSASSSEEEESHSRRRTRQRKSRSRSRSR